MAEVLFGRESEVGLIREFIDGRPGYESLLVISGEPGVGKSALLDLVAEGAESRGARVLHAGALEFEAHLAYSTINQLLLPYAHLFGGLQTEHEEALSIICGLRSGPAPGLLLAGAATLSVVGLITDSGSALVIVDDSQWMDPLSAMTLTFLGRRLTTIPAKILVAARTDEDDVFVRSGFRTLVLEPLSDADADDLLVDRFPALSPSVRHRIQREALGNPLGLLELPAALESSETWTAHDVLPLTNRLKALYERRLSGLPQNTRQILLFVVLAGAENSVTIEKCLPTNAGRQDFPPAEQARLIRFNARTGRWEFRHPLIRSTVFEMSSPQERSRVHAILADAFADQPERRAWHLGQAATEPDESIAEHLEGVSQRLIEVGDCTRATAAMLKAAELSPSYEARERRIARAAYLGSLVTGALTESPRLLTEALRNPSQSPQLATVTAVAYHLLNSEGEVATAQRLLLAALDARNPGADDPSDEWIEALYTLVWVGFFGGNGTFWPSQRKRATHNRPLPEPLELQIDLFVDAARASSATLERFAGAADTTRFTADPLRIVRLAMAGAYIDALEGTRGSLWRVVEDGRRGEAVTPAIQALFLLAIDDYFAGEWGELEEVVREGLELSSDHGYVLTTAPVRFLRALVDAARGEEASAHRAAEELLVWAAPRRLTALADYSSHIRCMTALPKGHFDEAFTHAATISPPGILRPYVPHAVWVAFDLIEAATRSGRRGQAAMHLRALESIDLAVASTRLRPLVLAAEGLVDEGADWRGRFDAALTAEGSERWRFDRARIRLLYGEQLRRSREVSAAKLQLTEARRLFSELGAAAWVQRVDRELLVAGGSEKPSGSLTAQEAAVAERAASGLSNKEIAEVLFLSPRTVSTHLSHVFAKLSIVSRAGLRDALSAESEQIRQ